MISDFKEFVMDAWQLFVDKWTLDKAQVIDK